MGAMTTRDPNRGIPASDKPPEIDLDVEEQPLELETAPEAEAEAAPRRWRQEPTSSSASGAPCPTPRVVYRMLNRDGDVLYVGKAKKLKARVASYARGQGHSNRIARMIAETASMEFVVTATETEALLLETNYIKQFRPRFNVLMRDDKSFPTSSSRATIRARRSSSTAGRATGGRLLRSLRFRLGREAHDSTRCRRPSCCGPARTATSPPARGLPAAQIKRCSGPCTAEVSPRSMTRSSARRRPSSQAGARP